MIILSEGIKLNDNQRTNRRSLPDCSWNI